MPPCQKGEESEQVTNHGRSYCAKTCLTSSGSDNPVPPLRAALLSVSDAAEPIDCIAALVDSPPDGGESQRAPPLELHAPSATMLAPSAICKPCRNRDSRAQTIAARSPRRRQAFCGICSRPGWMSASCRRPIGHRALFRITQPIALFAFD